MGIGVSIFLLATGAILNWGVSTDPQGVDLGAIGTILMVVGLIGLLVSLVAFGDWAPWRRDAYRDRDVVRDRDVYVDEPASYRQTVVEEDPYAGRRTATVDEEPPVRRVATRRYR